MEPTTTTNKSHGALIGSIIIILILVLLGVYLIQNKEDGTLQLNEEQAISNENAQADNITAGNEIQDIEADLNANGDIDSLDKDLE